MRESNTPTWKELKIYEMREKSDISEDSKIIVVNTLPEKRFRKLFGS